MFLVTCVDLLVCNIVSAGPIGFSTNVDEAQNKHF